MAATGNFSYGIWADNWNLVKIIFALVSILMVHVFHKLWSDFDKVVKRFVNGNFDGVMEYDTLTDVLNCVCVKKGVNLALTEFRNNKGYKQLYYHFSDIILSLWRLGSPLTRVFVQQFSGSNIKKFFVKGPHHWPFVKGSSGDQMIPLK